MTEVKQSLQEVNIKRDSVSYRAQNWKSENDHSFRNTAPRERATDYLHIVLFTNVRNLQALYV